jgi:hypothetical protein
MRQAEWTCEKAKPKVWIKTRLCEKPNKVFVKLLMLCWIHHAPLQLTQTLWFLGKLQTQTQKIGWLVVEFWSSKSLTDNVFYNSFTMVTLTVHKKIWNSRFSACKVNRDFCACLLEHSFGKWGSWNTDVAVSHYHYCFWACICSQHDSCWPSKNGIQSCDTALEKELMIVPNSIYGALLVAEFFTFAIG